MVANGNVFVTFQGDNGCSYIGGTCVAGSAITFSASGFNYPFSCATHTFSWDFGDNHSDSGQTVTHKFSNAGTYNVALTINNGTQSITLHQPVTIASSSGATASTFDFNIIPYTVNGITIPNAYVFTALSIPPGAFSTWNWDFGDGPCGPQQCTGTPVLHVYPDGKNYTVTLTVPGQPNSVKKTIIARHRASGR